MPSTGERSDGEHARRGAPAPAGALDGPTAGGARLGAVPHPLARLAGPGTGRVRAAQLLRLQRAYGNAAVGRHLQRTPAPGGAAARDLAAHTPAAGAGHPSGGTGAGTAPRSGAVRVQRWKDDGHVQTTKEAAEFVFMDPYYKLFEMIGKSQDQFIAELSLASLKMDQVVAHLGDRFMPGSGERGQTTFWGFTGTLAKSVVGDALGLIPREGQKRRGIKGEGPDHGEYGYYEMDRDAAAPGNAFHTEMYVDRAVDALKAGDYDLMIEMLGNACHVAADRGSHDEGGQGQGHDTRMPDKKQGEEGTNLKLGPGKNFMENWADNDIVSLNPKGYKHGLICTESALRLFKIKVRELVV
jgi:hypothetical protein